MFIVETITGGGKGYYDHLDALPHVAHSSKRALRLLRAQTDLGVGTEVAIHHDKGFDWVSILPQFFRQTRTGMGGAGTNLIEGLEPELGIFPDAFSAGELSFHAEEMMPRLKSDLADESDSNRLLVFRVWHRSRTNGAEYPREVSKNIIFSTRGVAELNDAARNNHVSRPNSNYAIPYPQS